MSFAPWRTAVPRKQFKSEEIASKLCHVDVLTSRGQEVSEAICQIGATEVTYYQRPGSKEL
jgi:hypothetical protein